MTVHFLHLGGARTNNPNSAMFPQTDVQPDAFMQVDARRGPTRFSVTRRLVFKEGCGPCSCGTGGTSIGLAEYYATHTFTVGDVIATHILPMQSSLEKIWLNNAFAVPGLTFTLRVRGNSASNGGTITAPAPITIATIDANVVGDRLITIPASIYFDQNDMLELVITALPVTGFDCLDMVVGPTMDEYCRGDN